MTTITIKGKDGSTRVIRTIGNWSYVMALSLAKDLEGDNFSSVLIGKS